MISNDIESPSSGFIILTWGFKGYWTRLCVGHTPMHPKVEQGYSCGLNLIGIQSYLTIIRCSYLSIYCDWFLLWLSEMLSAPQIPLERSEDRGIKTKSPNCPSFTAGCRSEGNSGWLEKSQLLVNGGTASELWLLLYPQYTSIEATEQTEFVKHMTAKSCLA